MRSLSEEDRDEGLLYRLQALKVKDSSYRRGEVAEIIGEDYAKLKATYRHNEAVTSVAFSPDGKTILTGSYDKMVRLWDAATGKQLAFMKHDFGVRYVAFSPDGKAIIVARPFWIHRNTITGNTIKPKASRILPGRYAGGYRFIDDRGDRIQVAVKVTGDSIKIIELRFDRPTAPPIQGDPKELLEQWQKKLALKLDEKTGKIEKVVSGEW